MSQIPRKSKWLKSQKIDFLLTKYGKTMLGKHEIMQHAAQTLFYGIREFSLSWITGYQWIIVENRGKLWIIVDNQYPREGTSGIKIYW